MRLMADNPGGASKGLALRGDLLDFAAAPAWGETGDEQARWREDHWLEIDASGRLAAVHAPSWQPPQRLTVPLDVDLHDTGGTPLDGDTAARLRSLMAAIHELEPLDRALVLLYLDDQSHRDIAGVLGISESNVATKLHRLKRRLRQRLEDPA